MYSRHQNRESSLNAWPGFVDALTALVVVLIFVVLIFVVSQYYLTTQLSGQHASVQSLAQEVETLSTILNRTKKSRDSFEKEVSNLSLQISQLKTTHQTTKENFQVTLDAEQNRYTRLQDNLTASEAKKASLERQLSNLQEKLIQIETFLTEKTKQHEDSLQLEQQAQQALLLQNKQEKEEKSDLQQRLDQALLQLNKALEAQKLIDYKSEFFGRLKKSLGEREDLIVVGDRFVFQSEVLFPTASASLTLEGEKTLTHLAQSLKHIFESIPEDINWILRIDGHTDKRPIRNNFYTSNWELSAARALQVVKFLIKQGIPPSRLAGAGFGEYHPLSTTDESKNRRIELRIDQR